MTGEPEHGVGDGPCADGRAADLPGRSGETAPNGVLRQARRLVVAVVGSSVVLVGLAMVVLPGPAVVVIPAGIAILATEFAWARRLLRDVKARIGLRAKESGSSGPPAEHI